MQAGKRDGGIVWEPPASKQNFFGDFMIPLKFEHLQNPPPSANRFNQGAVFVAGEPQDKNPRTKTATKECEIPQPSASVFSDPGIS